MSETKKKSSRNNRKKAAQTAVSPVTSVHEPSALPQLARHFTSLEGDDLPTIYSKAHLSNSDSLRLLLRLATDITARSMPNDEKSPVWITQDLLQVWYEELNKSEEYLSNYAYACDFKIIAYQGPTDPEAVFKQFSVDIDNEDSVAFRADGFPPGYQRADHEQRLFLPINKGYARLVGYFLGTLLNRVKKLEYDIEGFRAWKQAADSAQEAAIAEAQKKTPPNGVLFKSRGYAWCPDVDPVSGAAFFKWIWNPTENQYVPTYQGPFVAYTLTRKTDEGVYVTESFDMETEKWSDAVEELTLKVVADGQATLPWGWAGVPEAPTLEMLFVMCPSWTRWFTTIGALRERYDALLASVPNPPEGSD